MTVVRKYEICAMKYYIPLLLCIQVSLASLAQKAPYPYPVKYFQLRIEEQAVRMAYMDVAAARPNGKTAVLLHGKNFNGYYWKDVIQFLTQNGFRVIVPDQVGWGKSDKPNIHYSFHLLAANTKKLLDALGIYRANLIVHSMGGMLGTRFVLMYPQTVEKLVYENPIGLEDYKTFVPYRPIEAQYETEMKVDFESLRKYQQSYFPLWRPAYDQYVWAQYESLQYPDFKTATWASAVTYEMIYEQPVVYEFKDVTAPTLIIIGQADRTVVGKNLLSGQIAGRHGQYPQLGRMLHRQIRNSRLVELPGIGHIPHIQAPDAFRANVLSFLK
jgi:pimeloyl-ACP methyl ester carboxylesterase